MRYTHHFHIIRHHHHALRISAILLIISIVLIFFLGFKQLDANQFLLGFLFSLQRVMIAYVISFALSLGLALLVARNKSTENVLLPILDALQSFPSISILPLLIVWFGRASIVAIIILVIAMIWPMLFSLLTSLKQRREDLDEAATIFGATGFKKFRFVTLHVLFSGIITGSIVAWGEAWETVLGAEIIISITGVGTYLYAQGQSNHPQILVTGIFLLLTILFILNKLLWLPLLDNSTKYQND